MMIGATKINYLCIMDKLMPHILLTHIDVVSSTIIIPQHLHSNSLNTGVGLTCVHIDVLQHCMHFHLISVKLKIVWIESKSIILCLLIINTSIHAHVYSNSCNMYNLYNLRTYN